MRRKVLIIGSSSFSGSSFSRWMLDKGWQVWGAARDHEMDPKFLPYLKSKKVESFTSLKFDLNKRSDIHELIQCLEQNNIEFLVNFAAQGMVSQSWDTPADWYQTNVVGQVLLHENLRKVKNLKKYVHVTTPEVYGSTSGWIKEDHVFAPSTPYAVSRAACDMHLKSFFQAYEFPVVFTRAANVYGPSQQLYRIIPTAFLSAKLGETMQLHGGGISSRSFVHIDDVSTATYKIMVNGLPGETYHISTDQLISIQTLVKNIFERTGSVFDDHVVIAEERLGKDNVYSLDSSKVREALGWCDQISLEEGLNQTESWIEANLDALKALPRHYIHKP